jgi:hypothetical protein
MRKHLGDVLKEDFMNPPGLELAAWLMRLMVLQTGSLKSSAAAAT